MAINLKNPDLYFNRELSWLKFNDRVLEEAMDTSHPLLERMKFLSIFSSNLDEFFMIRVAGLKEQIAADIHEFPADGMRPVQVLEEIGTKVHHAVDKQSRILLEDVLPKLRKKGVRIRYYNTLTATQKESLRIYFKEKIFPVLTPLAIDPSHPFPALKSLGLNFFIELRDPIQKREPKVAVLPIPTILHRFIPLPGKNKGDHLLLEDLIKPHLGTLFPNMKILNANLFRITRNADFELSEAEADDLLQLIEKELRKRRLGTVIRLEVSDKMSPEGRKFLQESTGLEETGIFEISGPLDLASFMYLMGLDFPALKDAPFTPALNPYITNSSSIFSALRKRDIMLYHPYDSFNHVVDLVQESARDPNVLAIKITLYRTSGKSPIVAALKNAAASGKQVTALIELKARFDEENNIVWAKQLEREGVNVVYGLLGLKTHCKILMIVRKEDKEIRRYVHLSTGNYNDKTAKLYTDVGIMTCNSDIGKDASDLFNLLTGYSRQKEWRKLFLAPLNLRSNLVRLIQESIQAHTKQNPSVIRMVMNSLVDPSMIQWLYKASMKGVKIHLVVRGICCLRPGVKGISENITVTSIVGRFLEHPRIFQFKFGSEEHVYMGSADLMQRNLNRRVETVFPIEDPLLREHSNTILDEMIADNLKTRKLNAKGEYIRVKPKAGAASRSVQEYFLEKAREQNRHVDTIS